MDFLFLMHGDLTSPEDAEAWGPYLAGLRARGLFDGGSGVGQGVCRRRNGDPAAVSSHITGYIRVRANDLDQAVELLAGNPVYEAGGTVEIRELPRDD
ncbi:MAG: hypothetical protein HY859_02165 [Caulobacterales bacterium]|nr:hypothetical protein [Caulobacterales bacterium]